MVRKGEEREVRREGEGWMMIITCKQPKVERELGDLNKQ